MHHALPLVTSPRKFEITQGNVTVGNVIRMREDDDKSWENLREGWQRVRWARERWQRRTKGAVGKASEAAESLGMKPGTYRTYERDREISKGSTLTVSTAERFARLFGVSDIWLLTGRGSPFKGSAGSHLMRIIRVLEAMPDEKQKAIADMIEAFEGRTGTEG